MIYHFVKKVTMKKHLIFAILSLLIIQSSIAQEWEVTNQYANDIYSGETMVASDDFEIICIGNMIISGGLVGEVKIFQKMEDDYQQLGNTIIGEENEDRFGENIGITSNGQKIAIGAIGNGTHGGYVKTYEWDGINWIKRGETLMSSNEDDDFGTAVQLSGDGNLMVVGGGGNGYFVTYEWNENDWLQKGDTVMSISDSTFSLGDELSLTEDGGFLAVAAPFAENPNGDSQRGMVQVYKYESEKWTERGSAIYSGSERDGFAREISFSSDGNTLAIGAIITKNSFLNVGSVSIYRWDESDWKQIGDDLYGKSDLDWYGNSIDISYDGARVITASRKYSSSNFNLGFVRVLDINNSNWEISGNDMPSDLFGSGFYSIFNPLGGAITAVIISNDGSTAIVKKSSTINIIKAPCATPNAPNLSNQINSQCIEEGMETTLALELSSDATNPSYHLYDTDAPSKVLLSENTSGIFELVQLNRDTTFFVSVLENGCESSLKEISIVIRYLPEKPTISVSGESDELFTSSSLTGNQWLLEGEEIEDATSSTYTATIAGNYSVRVTNQNNCSIESDQVEYTITLGLDGELSDNLIAYPNPFADELHINSGDLSKKHFYRIYAFDGSLVDHGRLKVKEGSGFIELSNLNAGTYILQLEVEGKLAIKKITKK